MRNTFFKALVEEARKNERIMLMTGDLGYMCSESFSEAFPDRFMNLGVSEENLVGMAAGLALSGLAPFTYSIATFMSMRGFEQIRNDVCAQRANVKIVGVGGGFAYGVHGPTHHALEDLGILRSLAHITLLSPADPVEVRLAVREMAVNEGPFYMRLGKTGEPILHKTEPEFRIGKGIVLREGADVVLFATGTMVKASLDAAELLAQERISAAVVSMHTIKPLDEELVLNFAAQSTKIITVEEHTIVGGLGTAVAEVLAEARAPARLKRLGIPDTLNYAVGEQSYMHDHFGISARKIAESAKAFVNQD